MDFSRIVATFVSLAGHDVALTILIKVWYDDLPRTSAFCNDLFPYQMSCPQTSHDMISIQTEIQRSSSVLRGFAKEINVRAVDICGFLFVNK
jgi:hypothetical protein